MNCTTAFLPGESLYSHAIAAANEERRFGHKRHKNSQKGIRNCPRFHGKWPYCRTPFLCHFVPFVAKPASLCPILLVLASYLLIPSAVARAQDADLPVKPSVESALDSVPDDPPADSPEDGPSSKTPKAKRFTDLGQAVTDAAKQRKGVFILFTAAWCRWCKKELKTFDQPDVAEALENWTVAVIDVDEHPKVAKRAGVESLPTVQVQTVDGQIIASQNGFLESDELIAWLSEHRAAFLLSGDEFAGDDPPDEATRDRLLEQFQNRNPVAREAAVQRLLNHRQHVVAAVAKSLETGPLQTRLTAWDLLHEWNAPVAAIDPWRPETLKPEAFAELKAWAAQIDPSAKDDEPLAPEQVLEPEDESSALPQTNVPAQD